MDDTNLQQDTEKTVLNNSETKQLLKKFGIPLVFAIRV